MKKEGRGEGGREGGRRGENKHHHSGKEGHLQKREHLSLYTLNHSITKILYFNIHTSPTHSNPIVMRIHTYIHTYIRTIEAIEYFSCDYSKTQTGRNTREKRGERREREEREEHVLPQPHSGHGPITVRSHYQNVLEEEKVQMAAIAERITTTYIILHPNCLNGFCCLRQRHL